MNEIVNRFLLAGEKCIPEMHLKQPALHIMLVDNLQKTKKEYKNLKKQEIHDIYIKKNYIKHVFNMAWLMDIFKN